MKILLFFSGQSSLSFIFKNLFSSKHSDVEIVNYLDFLPSYYHRLVDKAGKLPNGVEKTIRKLYIDHIQKKYTDLIKEKNPDLIFIYNDQMLIEETLNKINKSIKVAVYLADSPFFLNRRGHIIGLIRKADAVFAPDTYWLEQCRMIGVKKAVYLIPGYNEQYHFRISPTPDQKIRYSVDVFFMGSPYPESWGYKRSLFLSKFCKFNFRFIGPESWSDWFADFPELENSFVKKEGYLPDEELNVMMNCSKIIPVDANPGIINGFHIRVLDVIASGSLPIVEYRHDLDYLFHGISLPVIRNYNDIPDVAGYYLDNDKERQILIENLREKILLKYKNNEASEIIFSSLYN